MVKAVLVIDALRGFFEEGRPLYCGETARRMVPRIKALLERELERGASVFFICDRHAPDDLEFQVFPPHCVAGTEEAEIIPELQPYAREIVAKNRYSCFFNTDLDARLDGLKPDGLIICGVCTDICVLHTVADARNRDYEVEVPVDCVTSFDQSAHEFALGHMEKVLGARLVGKE